jgi:hypothetical protein
LSKTNPKKMETVKFLSPFGTARFPKVNNPDTDGKFADGKFKTGLLLNDSDVEKVRAEFKAAAKQLHPNVPLEQVVLPLKQLKDKDKETGTKKVIGWGFNAKSQRRPLILDAKKNKLPEGVKIGGGSEIRIGGAIAAYEKTSEQVVIENGERRKEEVTEYGLNIYLNSVQVRKLVVGGGMSDGSEFEEVEGYEYEGAENESAADDPTAL